MKKYLLFLFIPLILVPFVANGAISYVKTQATSAGSGSSKDTTTTITSVTAGDLLIMDYTITGIPSTVTVTDTNGTPVLVASTTWHSNAQNAVYYEQNAAAGTHSFHIKMSTTTSNNQMYVEEYTGAATSSALDTATTTTGSATLATAGPMTSGNITRIQAASGKNTGFASTVSTAAFGTPLTNGSVILACGENDTGAANSFNTPTDTAGNTYVRVLSKSVAATFDLEIWYALNTHTTASNVVTMTDTSGGVDSIAIAEEWKGIVPSAPIDASSSNSSTTGQSLTTGAFTTTNAKDFLWACAVLAAGVNDFVAGTGYSNTTTATTSFSNLAVESKIVSATSSNNIPASSTASLSWAMGGLGVIQDTSANEMAYGVAGQAGGSFTAGTGFTLRNTSNNYTEDNLASSLASGATVSTTFSNPGVDWNVIGSLWRPAVTVAATVARRRSIVINAN